MSGWKTVPLGEVAETQYGTSQKANDQGRGLPILRMSNITFEGRLDLSDLKHVELPPGQVDRCTVRAGDLLFNRTNSHELVGKMAVWNGRELYALAGYLVRVRLMPDKADARFVSAWFNTPQMKAELRSRAKPSINMSNISASELLKFSIPLPPISEQRRIAEILDRAEALRAKRRAALAELDTLTQAIFLDMFGDPALNPKGWLRMSLSDLCGAPDAIKCGPFGTQLGKDEYREEGVPLWGIKNVNAVFRLPTKEYVDPYTARRLQQYSIEPGDIVMTRKGTVGNCAVYPDDFPLGIMHSDLLRLRLDRERSEPRFFAHQLHYSREVDRQLALISGGAVMPGVNVTKLKSLEVLVPPTSEQRDFARRVAAVEKLKATHRASLAELDALFASLQHRAFRGEL